MKRKTNFHEELRELLDGFVHNVYDITLSFPAEERFGITSQLRRASISVILNYIEGFARNRDKVQKNFLEISYGSLKETNYLLNFSYKRKYINEKDYEELYKKADRIGRMIWGILRKL